jgi:hypothetical protein
MGDMNPTRPAWLPIALLTLLLCACGSPPVWQKAGTSETVVQNDTDDCRVKARLAPLPERYMGSPTSQSVTERTLSREEQRAMYEADEFQKCMVGKGYTAAKR